MVLSRRFNYPVISAKMLDITYIIAYVNTKIRAKYMRTISATKARAQLYKLLDEASQVHEPIQITGKRSNAILIGESDWRAIEETIYLLSIPNMRESIREGLKEPIDTCSKDLDW